MAHVNLAEFPLEAPNGDTCLAADDIGRFSLDTSTAAGSNLFAMLLKSRINGSSVLLRYTPASDCYTSGEPFAVINADNAADYDEDGLTNIWEMQNDLDPTMDDRYVDKDGDGVQNYLEYQWGTNANNPDTDGDDLTDGQEAYLFNSVYQPQYADTDCAPPPYATSNCGQHINDGDEDYDGDGMPNLWEIQNGLDPTVDDRYADDDEDGMPNLWELQNGLDPMVNDRYLDKDGDGVQNYLEHQWGTNANNPDTDGDGLTDGQEAYLFNSVYQPQYADTDCAPPPYATSNCGQHINDGDEDYDGDGMPNLWEIQNGLDPTVNDRYANKDEDGVQNYLEYQWGTNANNPDTDGDGLTDGQEAYLFNSYYQPQMHSTGGDIDVNDGDKDCDGDGISNLGELANNTDPTDGALCVPGYLSP
jgi:hypothetical protein